jgi:hypothetical protein
LLYRLRQAIGSPAAIGAGSTCRCNAARAGFDDTTHPQDLEIKAMITPPRKQPALLQPASRPGKLSFVSLALRFRTRLSDGKRGAATARIREWSLRSNQFSS